MSKFRSAVIICTRNRPLVLDRTLQSVADQKGGSHRLVMVVDASDAPEAHHVEQIVSSLRSAGLPAQYHAYAGSPSLARQRNDGVNQLPDTVEVVHFIDDDVTLRPDYFDALTSVLRSKPDVGGVGGLIFEPERTTTPTWRRLLKRVFFLDHPVDGRILPSGWTTSAQLAGSVPDDESLRSTEWLSGCSSSYRRSLFEHHRFDKALEGYSMLEDFDFSYRVGQETRLLVQPSARLLHRRASTNRFDAERYHRALTIHKRWFLDKNLSHPLARVSYWWSTVGRTLALLMSSDSDSPAALQGLLHGVHAVWHRDHPLLRRDASNAT